MKTLKNWKLQNQSAHHIELLVDGQHSLCLYILEENMFRVLLKRKGVLSLDRTWSIAPEKDVPWEGRHREDISGFSLPTWNMEQNDPDPFLKDLSQYGLPWQCEDVTGKVQV